MKVFACCLTLALGLACTGAVAPPSGSSAPSVDDAASPRPPDAPDPPDTTAQPVGPKPVHPPSVVVPGKATAPRPASDGAAPPEILILEGPVIARPPQPDKAARPSSSRRVRRADLERDFAHVSGIGDVASLRPNVTFSGIDGLVIRSIPPRSPLSRFGLQTGDIVHSVNGTPLGSSLDILGLVAALESASVFEGDITRDGRSQTIRVVLD